MPIQEAEITATPILEDQMQARDKQLASTQLTTTPLYILCWDVKEDSLCKDITIAMSLIWESVIPKDKGLIRKKFKAELDV